MPGGTFWVMKATCSVSAKKLSGIRSSTSRPIGTDGQDFLGMILVGSSTSKSKLVRKFLIEELHAEFPFREVAGLNGLPQVAPMEIGIGTIDLDGFVPDDRLQAELGLPVEFDEGGFVLRVDEARRYGRRSLP